MFLFFIVNLFSFENNLIDFYKKQDLYQTV